MRREDLLAQLRPVQRSELTSTVQGKIKIHPRKLNEELNGGVRGGQTMLIFGRPGAAKTLTAMNVAASFPKQEMRVVYIGNEESKRALLLRWLSLYGKENLDDLDSADSAASTAAIDRAMDVAAPAMEHFRVVYGVNSMCDVQTLVDEWKPHCVVLDQLRHMQSGDSEDGATSMVHSMESAQREFRYMANRNNFFGITISQANVSAEGKLVLNMGDLDGSKTGTQGAVDLIVGVGVDEAYQQAKRRMISICRNKISGRITFFPVRVNEQRTLILNDE